MKVKKRNGKEVEFDKNKIKVAVERAMDETIKGVEESISRDIADKIATEVEKTENAIDIEIIQDMVETYLMEYGRLDAAKLYILYRDKKNKIRKKSDKHKGLLTDDFISYYKHRKNPMKQLGSFVYYRTYSRWLDDEYRREYWWETVRRAVEYNCSLVPHTTKEEAEKLFDNIFNLKQFLSGRTLWVGGTDVAKKYPMSNFNCAFEIIDSFESYKDLFYLLMIGSGVGVRVLKEDVDKVPKIRTDYEIIHAEYTPVIPANRHEHTSLDFSSPSIAKITVGDSKEGWVQALDYLLKILYSYEYRNINTIVVNYDNVRLKGEKLKTFGGTASGHISLKTMFEKIDKVIKKAKKDDAVYTKLKALDLLDIANIIGENVVSGGVRRTSEIGLIDSDDEDSITAKSSLYVEKDGVWEIDKSISHRQMSNNSIYYKSKPTRDKLHWQIEQMRYSGEPAWVNGEAAAKRRPNMNGVNPCGEILLDSKGMCNLTTVNVAAFVNEDGSLDIEGMLEAQRLSTRAGLRMTCVEFELNQWNIVSQRDRLLGCSLTGWQDMVNASKISKEEEAKILRQLREAANDEAKKYSKELGLSEPLLVTCLKPEGTLSNLPTVSSGIHYSHSPYYIRRVRTTADDPITKVCEELGYPVFPEVGQNIEDCTIKVVEFPVRAPRGRTKYDVSAIEQLENYKMFMSNYVDHNCSITVHVRANEWDQVEQWIWDNWDDVIAVSFLPLDDSFYQLLPFEAIDEEEYNRRISNTKPFIPSLISKYEKLRDTEFIEQDCEGGVCPVR